jgi:hypothetical protein
MSAPRSKDLCHSDGSRNSIGEATPATLASPTTGGGVSSTRAGRVDRRLIGDIDGATERRNRPDGGDLRGDPFGTDAVDVEDNYRPPVAGESIGGGAPIPPPVTTAVRACGNLPAFAR